MGPTTPVTITANTSTSSPAPILPGHVARYDAARYAPVLDLIPDTLQVDGIRMWASADEGDTWGAVSGSLPAKQGADGAYDYLGSCDDGTTLYVAYWSDDSTPEVTIATFDLATGAWIDTAASSGGPTGAGRALNIYCRPNSNQLLVLYAQVVSFVTQHELRTWSAAAGWSAPLNVWGVGVTAGDTFALWDPCIRRYHLVGYAAIGGGPAQPWAHRLFDPVMATLGEITAQSGTDLVYVPRSGPVWFWHEGGRRIALPATRWDDVQAGMMTFTPATPSTIAELTGSAAPIDDPWGYAYGTALAANTSVYRYYILSDEYFSEYSEIQYHLYRRELNASGQVGADALVYSTETDPGEWYEIDEMRGRNWQDGTGALIWNEWGPEADQNRLRYMEFEIDADPANPCGVNAVNRYYGR